MNNNESGNSGWINKNLTAYKITISVIFGLLGFSINFLTISFFGLGTGWGRATLSN